MVVTVNVGEGEQNNRSKRKKSTVCCECLKKWREGPG